VAVIGTLLALLVFFALFGIFLTQYVPLWMSDNESAFTSSVATSFAQFKSDVDTQAVLGVPQTLGAPFVISSQGVPLLAQPTEGALLFLPQTCPANFYTKGVSGATSANFGQPVNPAYCVFENQTIRPGFGGSSAISLEVTTGILSMQLPNRYFSPETFSYEADGVVQTQSAGYQIMAFAPPFNVTKLAGNTTISSSFLQLYGNATTVVAQGSEEVYSHLRFFQHITYNGYNSTGSLAAGHPVLRPFNYTYEIGTQSPCAWARFLQAQMNASGVSYALTPTYGTTSYNWTNPVTHLATIPFTGSCSNGAGATTIFVLNISSISYVSVFYAGTQVSVGIGSS